MLLGAHFVRIKTYRFWATSLAKGALKLYFSSRPSAWPPALPSAAAPSLKLLLHFFKKKIGTSFQGSKWPRKFQKNLFTVKSGQNGPIYLFLNICSLDQE